MNGLGLQANFAQLFSHTKLPLRQRQKVQQDFQHHFQVAVSANEKLTISKHVLLRMSQRNMEMAPQTCDKITDKAKEAKRWG
ncbi:hypothetical protein ACQKNS_04705 [Peribacillus sp. NPDC094092]|uniref:hypothetical protein n=1 Tax=Peribacillus sp. NPDC094092 TaxID=3390611 RepID=UPI003CFE0C0E